MGNKLLVGRDQKGANHGRASCSRSLGTQLPMVL